MMNCRLHAVLGFCTCLLAGAGTTGAPYQQADRTISERVEDLLSRMTIEEKAGQLTQVSAHGSDESVYEQQMREGSVGSYLNVAFNWVHVSESGVYQENPNGTLTNGAARMNALQRIAVEESRLGIPCLFAHDVLHGFRTIFPVPLAMASSWNPESVEHASRVAAVEASSLGLRWVFAPMIDVTRDPRWGRIVEGGGEDPLLNSILAAAAVRGFQSGDLSESTHVLATPKHFVAYGAAEGGRDYNTADISERTLREVYLPPFKAAFAAGAGSTMVAFNDIAGIPATANQLTLRTILRSEWDFQGLVVSDWGSIGELQVHGFAANLADAAQLALEAGVDVDMESGAYQYLPALLAEGRISVSTVDHAVRRMLRAKFELGLFERPYVDENLAATVLYCREHQRAAREVARQSIVLLKNDGGLLPLARPTGTIAVVGSLAHDPKAQLGSWLAAGASGDSVTVLEGIRQGAGKEARVIYAAGASPETNDTSGIAEAVQVARQSDVVVAVLGELGSMSGEARSRATLDLPGAQQQLLYALHATGKPVVLVLMSGRPLTIEWATEHIPAILAGWFGGSQAGPAVADVLFGEFNPCGKLPVTWPRAVGQVPLYYNHNNTGRPTVSRYEDIESSPLYPFGHGLSYTSFQYEDLVVSESQLAPHEKVHVTLRLSNVGTRAGTEVVQLYVRDPVASVARPVLELKDFRRVTLPAGTSEEVAFELAPDQLAFHNQAMERVVEPGVFEVQIGPDSAEGLTAKFEMLASPKGQLETGFHPR